SLPTSPSRNSIWPAWSARHDMREASASISAVLNARKTSSMRSTAMVAGAALPARGIAGPPAGASAKPSAPRSSVIERSRRSAAGVAAAVDSRRSMTTRTPSSSAHCRDNDSNTSGRLRATTRTSSIVPILSQARAAPGDRVGELLGLRIGLFDVGRAEAAGGHVAGDRIGIDRHGADVADVARSLERLPFRIQEVLDARHDQGLGPDRLERLRVVAVEPRRGAHVVRLVGPGL